MKIKHAVSILTLSSLTVLFSFPLHAQSLLDHLAADDAQNHPCAPGQIFDNSKNKNKCVSVPDPVDVKAQVTHATQEGNEYDKNQGTQTHPPKPTTTNPPNTLHRIMNIGGKIERLPQKMLPKKDRDAWTGAALIGLSIGIAAGFGFAAGGPVGSAAAIGLVVGIAATLCLAKLFKTLKHN